MPILMPAMTETLWTDVRQWFAAYLATPPEYGGGPDHHRFCRWNLTGGLEACDCLAGAARQLAERLAVAEMGEDANQAHPSVNPLGAVGTS